MRTLNLKLHSYKEKTIAMGPASILAIATGKTETERTHFSDASLHENEQTGINIRRHYDTCT